MPWDIILGGITGLFGNIITAWSNFKTQKLKNEHDEAMYQFKIQELGAKTDAAIKITEAKIAGAVELADSEAFKVAQQEGNKQSFADSWIDKLFSVEGWLSYLATPVAVILAMLLGCVDVLKGIMRPGLTLYLTGITTWLTWTAYGILQQVGASMSSQQALDIYEQVTSIVIYLTVSCVTWWFGDRRIAKFLMRLNDGNIKGGNKIVNVPKGQLPQ